MADVQRAPNVAGHSLHDTGTQTGTKKNTATLQAQVPEEPTSEVENLKGKVDDGKLEERLPEPEADVPEAEVPEADVPEADVPEADLQKADLQKPDLKKADVPEADVPEEVSKTKDSVEETAGSTEKPDLEKSTEVPDVGDVKDNATEQLTNGDDPQNLADTPENLLGGDEVKDATESAEKLTNGELPEDATKDVDEKLGDTTEKTGDPTEEVGEKVDDTTKDADERVGDTTKDVGEKVDDTTKDVGEKVDDTTKDADEKLGDTTGELGDKAEDTTKDLDEKVDDAPKDIDEKAHHTTEGAKETTDEIIPPTDEATSDLKEGAEGATKDVEGTAEEATDGLGLKEKTDEVPQPEEATSELKDNVEDAKPTEGDLESKVDEVTPEIDDAQKPLGDVEATAEDAKSQVPEGVEAPDVEAPDAEAPNVEAPDVEAPDVEAPDVEAPDVEVPEVPDLSILKDKKVNKLGKIVDENGTPFGVLTSGDAKKLAGKKVDAQGQIWDDTGKVIGTAELLPESERDPASIAPFEDFPEAIVDKSGNILFEGKVIGRLTEGDGKKLAGKKVDADGDVLDKHGNVIGKAERWEEEEPEPEPEVEVEKEDLSLLEGKKVNKAGNVVDDNGKLFGRVVEGEVARLVGKPVDKEGKIWSDAGRVIGRAELIPVDEREADSGKPFEDFPNAVIGKDGKVLFDGVIVGRLIEGDAKKLVGKKVDEDGEVVDKIGNVLGKAERWEEEEVPEPEPEVVDLSALAGKRVNKLGYLVDSNGNIFGRLVSGDPKKLVGRMSDKNGDIWNDGGVVIGKAELTPDSDRAGQKEGPFAAFENPKVIKDGKVAESGGVIVGRLIEGDPKKLFGKTVDPDGDVLDSNGNTIGKAERWEEEEKEVRRHPAAGRRVNKRGEVVDDNGDVIAKLTDGDLLKCAGKEIDDDGDVVDGKGSSIGHVTLLEDIPEPEPEPEPEPVVEEPKETEEEIAERKQLEQDKKLANQMAACISQSIDKIQPILKMITDAIDAAERQPKDELDEQKLVDTVKPLIEEGAGILQEANGVIRGLDPDGRIQGNAKGKAASREATPEEFRLAEVLKELTGSVTQTIDQAKKKIAGMPHAKKELNPLWGLLAEPLGQILAAVGLLLAGVLGLVGRLLSGLGLGGLLDNLLGGLGIKGILQGLGLGFVTKSLTGKK